MSRHGLRRLLQLPPDGVGAVPLECGLDRDEAEVLRRTGRQLLGNFAQLLRNPADTARQQHQLGALVSRTGKLNLDSLEVESDEGKLLSHALVYFCRDPFALGSLNLEQPPAEICELGFGMEAGAA